MDDSTQQPTVFDTDQQQLGVVYAKALLAVGQESGNLDQLVEQLSSVVEVVEQVPGLKGTLESPRIAAEEKFKLLDKAFSGKVEKSLLNFLKVVGKKGRFDCLAAIGSAARKMQDEMSGRIQAVLTSASEIDSGVIGSLSEKLSGVFGKTVSLRAVVDPDIIGGMVVRVGDTVYDASVVSQLAQLRTKTIKKASDSIREKLDRFATASDG